MWSSTSTARSAPCSPCGASPSPARAPFPSHPSPDGVQMTEQSAPDTGTPAPPDTGSDSPPDTGAETTDWRAEAEKYRELHRKQETRAKANAEAARELERVRRETMSETERAVAEAVARREADLRSEDGSRLAGAALDGALGSRMAPDAKAALLAGLDFARFLDEAGEVDQAAVNAFASTVAPESHTPTAFPDLGQGVRVPVANGSPDPLLGALKGKLGIQT